MTDTQTIDGALRFIPADDRLIWLKIGMAIKSELGDDGYSLWDYWSQSGQSYSERNARQAWRSFKDGRIKIATLFHYAREYGYRPDMAAPARPIPEKKAPPPQRGNTSAYAARIWLKADCSDKAVSSHPYAIAKGIGNAGGAGRATVTGCVVGTDANCIVIPIRDLVTNRVVGVQCINPEGTKQTFGKVSGNGLLLGNTLDKDLNWFVSEGWASSYSMVFHHCHGNACCATAFGKGNLDTIAQRVAEVYQPERLVIIREQDA